MKKLLLALAVTGLLAGCASRDHSEGGTTDDGYNNATRGTGSSTATNEYWNATGSTNQDSSTMPNQ